MQHVGKTFKFSCHRCHGRFFDEDIDWARVGTEWLLTCQACRVVLALEGDRLG